MSGDRTDKEASAEASGHPEASRTQGLAPLPAQEWVLDSRLELAHEAAERVRAVCGNLGYPDLAMAEIELCVVEAFANAVEHGYSGEPGHEVVVRVSADEEYLHLGICQYGGVVLEPDMLDQTPAGFDDLEDPLDLQFRGRGLRIIKAHMGNCEVRAEDGRRCLVMSRTLP